MATTLGPWGGVYKPQYEIKVYRGGDPRQPLGNGQVNWRSVMAVNTSKSISDVAGQFEIMLKDRRARDVVRPMDVVVIRLGGHNQPTGTVLKGVVDECGESDQAGSAQQDTLITGRCVGKYLQINSLFLPVWDPAANLPTALVFGVGGVAPIGQYHSLRTPREIFGYIFDTFVVGKRNKVGESGTPNARFWIDRTKRFEKVDSGDVARGSKDSGKEFQIPFVQFDEDPVDQVLTRLTVQGFTESFVDELGHVVYRKPGWLNPVDWSLHTSGLVSDNLQNSDVGTATYVEVFPGALPAVSSGVAQALLSGRAPLPSDYVTGLRDSGFRSPASREFIIDVDSKGQVTAKGRRNPYYQLQRKYGIRAYQVTSPLLATREQAQAQAEGLLRFLLRLQKSGTVTIPGEPQVKIGQTLHLHGALRGRRIDRTFYIEGVDHSYQEGQGYTTTLTLSHGRDPGDPGWKQMVLPEYSASALAEAQGILGPKGGGGGGGPTPTAYHPGTASGGFANPFPGGWVPARLDMGYDGTFTGQIVAPFDGTISYAGPYNGWRGSYGVEITANGDVGLPTRTLYFTEGVSPIVRTGQSVKAGTPIANAAPSPYGNSYGQGATGAIEWGVATGASGSQSDTYAVTLGQGAAARRMVLQFAKWAQTVLGLAAPSSTDHAGVA